MNILKMSNVIAFTVIAAFITLTSTTTNAQTDKTLTQLEQENRYLKFQRRLHFKNGIQKVSNDASIDVPAPFQLLSSSDSVNLLYLLGQPAPTGLLGSLIHDMDIITVSEFNRGHLSNTKIEASEILKTAQDLLKQTSGQSVQIVDWLQSPKIENQTLSWALKYKIQKTEGEATSLTQINHAILTRRGAILFRYNTLHSEGALPDLQKIGSSIQIQQGSRFEDFDPSKDVVYATGAAGLIAGQDQIETYQRVHHPVVVALNFLNNLFFIFIIFSWISFLKRARARNRDDQISKADLKTDPKKTDSKTNASKNGDVKNDDKKADDKKDHDKAA